MTPEDLDLLKHLAEKVKGGELIHSPMGDVALVVYGLPQSWNPLKNANHTQPLLDGFLFWIRRDDGIEVKVQDDDRDMEGHAVADDMNRAICLAVARATGYTG